MDTLTKEIMIRYKCEHIEIEIRKECLVYCPKCKKNLISDNEIEREETKLNKSFIINK